MEYLLDSNVIIDFFNAKLPETAKNILTISSPAISVITNIELFASDKIPAHERLLLVQFVNMATVYDTINKDIVTKTIAIRQQYKTKLPDAIIAATAMLYGLTLITRNINDFKNIEGLQVIDPYAM